MSVVTLPLNKESEEILNNMIKNGVGSSKADVFRKALQNLAEEQAVLNILESENNIRQGKVFEGDLRKISKKLKK